MTWAPACACAAILVSLLAGCSHGSEAPEGVRLQDVQRARAALARQQQATTLFRGGDYGAAARVFQDVLDALPDDSHSASAAAWLKMADAWEYRRLLSSLNNNLGLAHLRARRPARAEYFFREALRLFPHSRQAHVNLGHARYHSADPAGALASFETALALRFSDPPLLLAAGRAARRLGRWDEARQWLARAEASRAHLPAIDAFGVVREASYELGMLEFAMRRPEAAERALRRSLDLAPGDPKARYQLVQVLDALGRVDEARAERGRFEHDAAAMAQVQALLVATPDKVDAIGQVALRYEELGLLDFAWVHYAQLAARSRQASGPSPELRDLERTARRQLNR